MDLPTDDFEALKSELNAQTGKIEWPELARHFARGVVLVVDPQLDLVETAAYVVNDRVDQITPLLDTGQIARATDDHARSWSERNPLFWATVASPWVLVQEASV